jgi:D-alanyl-D-alanine carboxypeptidase/D-alanyl-D-alanine-endopeptidase (penicillin-binding protein 4)
MPFQKRLLYSIVFLFILSSCAVQKQLGNNAPQISLLQDSSLRGAHIGIAVYDPSNNKYLYQYQDDKYFVPASNTKLFSLYAGLKCLGDSLPAIRYAETDTALFLLPAGDPSLLHPDFSRQPLIDLLRKTKKPVYVMTMNWKDQAWGSGWSWDDYNDDYMVERSPLPVYGNVIKWTQEQQPAKDQGFSSSPSVYSLPEVEWKLRFSTDTGMRHFFVKRKMNENVFEVTQGSEYKASQDIPFITYGVESAIELLKDTVGYSLHELDPSRSAAVQASLSVHGVPFILLHSQPVDSLFRPLMYRSDNFFAEQVLMMVSQTKLGIMNDEQIIDTLLRSDLSGLPQKPHWADGSGLSRFNLFSPQDFIWLLNKMQREFGLERLKRLLPTGGSGTLHNYYKQDIGHIYAKTGSLSDVIALSGYLLTKKNHLLIFSVLVNNHQGNVTSIRRAVESFVHGLVMRE